MVHSIDEDLALDKIKASLKQIPLITDAFINAEGQLIFRFTDDTQMVIDLKEVVRSY